VKVGVPKESLPGGRCVALVPEAARALVNANLQVAVEAGAVAAAFLGNLPTSTLGGVWCRGPESNLATP